MGIIRGTVHLCIPEHFAMMLQLRELEQRKVILAGAHRRTMPIMGPIEVSFANRRCYTGAMVLGNKVLLGAIPMKDMDLVLRTQLQDDDFEPGRPARCKVLKHAFSCLNVAAQDTTHPGEIGQAGAWRA